MLTAEQRQTCSDLLYRKWLSKERIDALPAECRPGFREEAYGIQALIEGESALPLFGWKIAATSVAGQHHIGVSGPLVGRILHERTLAPGSELSLDANLMKVAEIEFAFRMGRDVPPRTELYDVPEVLDAVSTLHPAIEIPDSRYNDFATAGEAQLIADNACAHMFMLGEASTADWRSLDLSTYEVTATVAGTGHVHQGIGSNVLGDPRVALTWMVNELSSLGVPLKTGQVVTTGTCMVPIPVQPGDRVDADYGKLGKIGIQFI